MNKQLRKQNLKFDIGDIKDYLEELKQEYRFHQRESKKIITKVQRQLKRLDEKQKLYKSL
jgi:hypothetical protein